MVRSCISVSVVRRELEIVEIATDKKQYYEGETAKITAVIKNPNIEPLKVKYTFYVNGSSIGGGEVLIPGLQVRPVVANYTFRKSGLYNICIEAEVR